MAREILALIRAEQPAPQRLDQLLSTRLRESGGRAGLASVFGVLVAAAPSAAARLEPDLFGGSDGQLGWKAWLLLANPTVAAAELLQRHYAEHVARLEGIEGRRPGPLDPDTRVGTHLLLLAVLAPSPTGWAKDLAHQFLATVGPQTAAAALLPVRFASRLDGPSIQRVRAFARDVPLLTTLEHR